MIRSRTRCVYCGAILHDKQGRPLDAYPLTCTAHRGLVALDPHYTEQETERR